MTFKPAVILTKAERARLENIELLQRIDYNRAHPERRRSRPSRSTARRNAAVHRAAVSVGAVDRDLEGRANGAHLSVGQSAKAAD